MALGLLVTLECPDCADVRAFTQPPCADGHGPDCPEWCCVDCGAAVFVEAVFVEAVFVDKDRSRSEVAGSAARAQRALRGVA